MYFSLVFSGFDPSSSLLYSGPAPVQLSNQKEISPWPGIHNMFCSTVCLISHSAFQLRDWPRCYSLAIGCCHLQYLASMSSFHKESPVLRVHHAFVIMQSRHLAISWTIPLLHGKASIAFFMQSNDACFFHQSLSRKSSLRLFQFEPVLTLADALQIVSEYKFLWGRVWWR